MDVLSKELNGIYRKQGLDGERLDEAVFEVCCAKVKVFAEISGKCCVMTDIAADRSFFVAGRCGRMLGLSEAETLTRIIASSDEDFLYERIEPRELVELRMLEYTFLKTVHALPPEEKLCKRAVGTVWMRGRDGETFTVNKSSQILQLSPAGRLWLQLCSWDISEMPHPRLDINPMIIDNSTGRCEFLNFDRQRQDILSTREKEILLLIRDGLLSKEIADRLTISLHTVNRHRQNILEKLSVDNSIEAVNAAVAMRLI